MQGLVDDLKAVTSGSWLRRPSHPQLVEAIDWTARILVYIAVVVLANAKDAGKIGLTLCALLEHGLLARFNAGATELTINERNVRASTSSGSIKKYSRRLDMAEELIKEMGRRDFAVRLGLVNPERATTSSSATEPESKPNDEVVTM